MSELGWLRACKHHSSKSLARIDDAEAKEQQIPLGNDRKKGKINISQSSAYPICAVVYRLTAIDATPDELLLTPVNFKGWQACDVKARIVVLVGESSFG